MVANLFGKIFAIKGRFEAQQKVSHLTRAIHKIVRRIGREEKQMAQSKRAEMNHIRQSFSVFSQGNIARQVMGSGEFEGLFKNGVLDQDFARENQVVYDQYQQAVASAKVVAQNDMQAALDEIETKYEYLNEMIIEPLNDEQADLEAQKVTAEAEIKVCEGMEKQEGEFANNNFQRMFDSRA